MTPSLKQRGVTMKRNGMDDALVGAVLGLSADDVRALLYEADPDVAIGAGFAPTFHGIPVDPALEADDLPEGSGIQEWSDLAHATAPTDAGAYLFQVDVVLKARDNVTARIEVLAADAQTFDDFWNGSGAQIPAASALLSNEGPDKVTTYQVLNLIVAAGQELGFYRSGTPNVDGDGSEDALCGFSNARWLPLG